MNGVSVSKTIIEQIKVQHKIYTKLDLVNDMRNYGIELVKYSILFVAMKNVMEGSLPYYSVIPYLILLFYQLNSRHKKMLEFIESFIPIPQDSFVCQKNKILKLAKKMEVEGEFIFYYNKASHFSPYVLQTKKNYFILPRNLLSISKSKPKLFDAIIAHELGHLIRRDTKMMFDNDNIKEFLFVAILDVIVNFVFGNLLNPFAYLSLLFIFYIILNSLYKANRYNSELMSDLASIAFTGRNDLIEVLNETYISEQKAANHPSLSERIENLNSISMNGQIIKKSFIKFLLPI